MILIQAQQLCSRCSYGFDSGFEGDNLRKCKVFGFELKDKQIVALEAILGRSDVFVFLPTGYGKSVIYALLPHAFDKLRGSLFPPRLVYHNYAHSGCLFNLVCFLCLLGTSDSIVSPLISLMMDQKLKYSSKGVQVEFVSEEQENCLNTERSLTVSVHVYQS